MAKQKRQLTDEAHFVADLPLEECMKRLQQLNNEQVKFHFIRRTSDQVDFTAQWYEAGQVRVTGTGGLCRWEGTLTRVECKIKTHDGILRWAMLSMLSLVLFIPMIPLTALYLGTPMFWPLLLSFFGLGCLWVIVFRRFAPPDDTPPNLLRLIDTALK